MKCPGVKCPETCMLIGYDIKENFIFILIGYDITGK